MTTLYQVTTTNAHGARVTTHGHTQEAAVDEAMHRTFGLGHTLPLIQPDRAEVIAPTPASGLLLAMRATAKPRRKAVRA